MLTNASSIEANSEAPYFLTGKEAVWGNFAKAPALGSPVDGEDLMITLSIQDSRTEAQNAEAYLDKKYSIKLVDEVIDPNFESKYPRTYAVLKEADHDGRIINSVLKNENGRLRPYVQHPVLVTPLFMVPDFSYPSGHASGSELQARILGKLFPLRAEDLLKRARQGADSRVVAGVHYASDTEAGLVLGDLLFDQFEANPKFVSELSAAAKEDHIQGK